MKPSKPNKNGMPNLPHSINIIGDGTKIEGEINSNGDIRIDGKLKGVVNSKAKVVVGTTGDVDGDIYCESAEILGKLSGTVEVKDILFLMGTAKIDGDIHTSKLVIESGAVFNGNCSMGDKKAPAAVNINTPNKSIFSAKKEVVV